MTRTLEHPLTEIRAGLRGLGARRRRARVVDVLLIGAAAAAVALVAYYLVDRRLTLSVASRLFLDVVLAVGLGWFIVRKLWPALRRREDAIDTALRFERRRGIDADLVAALEFEPAVAAAYDGETAYGSSRLAGAVVDDVAESGRDWNFADEPIDAAPPWRRIALAAVVAFGVALAFAFPRHAAVFFERLALGSTHYPSNTRIDELTVSWRPQFYNDLLLDPADAANNKVRSATVPLGRPLMFELQTSGTPPKKVEIELTGTAGGAASLELAPIEGRENRFRAVLPAAIEDLSGRAVAGDAYTETFQLYAAPLPTVTVTLEVRPPTYAADAVLDVPPPGRLYAAVLEGSDVAIRIESANKRLARVVLMHGDDPYSPVSPDEGRTWRLEPQKTPLAAIKKPVEFTIDVTDEDEFALVEPLRGSIALRPDQPPSVAADVVTKFVLPEGKPSIFYQATDDLGVESLRVERQVQRVDGTAAADSVPIPPAPDQPRTSLAGKFPLELSSLQLHKGDKVTIRLSARDRRGNDPRAVAESEPFVLEVTDEQGLYEAMAETDQRSALKMDEIIQKQLMMTGRPAASPASTNPAATNSGNAVPPKPTASPTSTPPGGMP
jgi:hypothetical protein